MIPRSKMLENSDTAEMMLSEGAQVWMGPHRSVLAYPISKGKLYNVAITALGDGSAKVGKWDSPVDTKQLRSMFTDFCAPVQTLLSLVDNCAKWSIAEIPSLETWSSKSGRCVLLGDAAHAMSPHVAQGGAMAIEDAAVLGECLASVGSEYDLKRATSVYYDIRHPRVSRVAQLAKWNGSSLILEDGPQQRMRDEGFAAATRAGAENKKSQDQSEIVADMNANWPQPALLKWLYGYDAVQHTKSVLSGQ